ncbi:ABC transporter permease [Flexistipes sinusarabici]|uniref:ABC transporter permease n=1 Tax=Flexistipes sinusarabici TaxID=2352 RepID=A0A3D5QD04_FLESI|nr:ABC transporter permease [Flexistipes sinusarabici]HCW93735.1 ABC transporter permease [Flexistipes sinusarabici]
MNINKMAAVYIKELKELRRDKISRIMVFFMPITILIIFGYGMAMDVENIPFSVLDYDKSVLSRELVSKFSQNKRYYSFKGYVSSQDEGIKLIDKGRIRTLIVIPENFSDNLKQNRSANIQIMEDGVFPYRASVSSSYAEAIVSDFNLDVLENKGIKYSPLNLKVRYWFNEEMKQKYVTTSGVLAIALFLGSAMISSQLIVKEKESGSIYNIYTSSISKLEFILSKQMFGFTIFVINYLILFLLIIFLFQVPFKGNFLLFTLSSMIYILVSTALGILISTFVNTQVTAVVGTAIICIIPAFLYSGYIAPVSSMTNEAYVVAHLFPTYYYLNIVKMFFLKGVNMKLFINHSIILIAFYFALIACCVLRFRKYEK